MKTTMFNTTPNHNISAQSLTVETLHQMSPGDLMISPTGNFFVMGDQELVVEIVPTGEYEDLPDTVKEYEFEDIAGTKRRIIFINNYAVDYDIITINRKIPTDTTGLEYIEEDDPFNGFVHYELGLETDPYDFIGE
jgi:hypothetical protein